MSAHDEMHFQNDAMQCGSEAQLILAWSVSFKTTTIKLALGKLGTYNKQDEVMKHCLATAKKKIKEN